MLFIESLFDFQCLSLSSCCFRPLLGSVREGVSRRDHRRRAQLEPPHLWKGLTMENMSSKRPIIYRNCNCNITLQVADKSSHQKVQCNSERDWSSSSCPFIWMIQVKHIANCINESQRLVWSPFHVPNIALILVSAQKSEPYFWHFTSLVADFVLDE